MEEWKDLITRAGLEVVFFETFRRTHPFQEWARRVGLEDDGVRGLENSFLAAKEKIKEQFRIEVVDGKVMSYTDEKGMWVLKPAGH